MTQGEWVLLFDMYLTIFWSVTYLECIRIGLRQKTYCMPLFALVMNFSWELLSFVDGLIHSAEGNVMLIYGIWLLLDCGVLYTCIRYGNQETKALPERLRIKTGHYTFTLRMVLCVAVIIGVLILMYLYVDNWKLYFSFTDNLLMSALFIAMYYVRGGGNRGQSLSIAITKCIGTICATITCTIYFSLYAVIIGFACLLLDGYYIYLLSKKNKVYEKD